MQKKKDGKPPSIVQTRLKLSRWKSDINAGKRSCRRDDRSDIGKGNKKSNAGRYQIFDENGRNINMS